MNRCNKILSSYYRSRNTKLSRFTLAWLAWLVFYSIAIVLTIVFNPSLLELPAYQWANQYLHSSQWIWLFTAIGVASAVGLLSRYIWAVRIALALSIFAQLLFGSSVFISIFTVDTPVYFSAVLQWWVSAFIGMYLLSAPLKLAAQRPGCCCQCHDELDGRYRGDNTWTRK